jgi:hypothetical protein
VEQDESILEFATPRQAELIRAYWKEGTAAKACTALGLPYSYYPNIYRALKLATARAARAGIAPSCDHTHRVPEGYRLRGVSSLYVKGQAEPALQWVKTTHDDEKREELLREMVAGFCEDLPREASTPAPAASLDDLCAVYPVGDHHLGMYAWAEEAGEDYDLDIGERLLNGAFEFLTGAMPNARTGLVVFLGDLFHYDSLESVTPTSKHLLDSDGRYAKMVRTCIRVVRSAIRMALAKHEQVRVIVQPGNHDPSSSMMLTEALAAIYEQEPRISVDRSPSPYHYWQHGSCLIGVCHGHEARKLDKLPILMASHRPTEWGVSKHRYWYTGHVHSDRVLDVEGTRVESFRVLPPTDAWAHGKGYVSAREMKALVLHKEHGETMRIAFRPEMLR